MVTLLVRERIEFSLGNSTSEEIGSHWCPRQVQKRRFGRVKPFVLSAAPDWPKMRSPAVHYPVQDGPAGRIEVRLPWMVLKLTLFGRFEAVGGLFAPG